MKSYNLLLFLYQDNSNWFWVLFIPYYIVIEIKKKALVKCSVYRRIKKEKEMGVKKKRKL